MAPLKLQQQSDLESLKNNMALYKQVGAFVETSKHS